MMPISEIKDGDQFSNPLFRYDQILGVVFSVEKVNEPERMVLMQARNPYTGDPIDRPFWKKNTDRMFSETWRCP